MTTNRGTRLDAALHNAHVRRHGRGRIIDAVTRCVVIAQTHGNTVTFHPRGTGNDSWVLTFNGTQYHARRNAGSGAPNEEGVIYLLDAVRLGKPIAEWRNADDVRAWFANASA